MRTLNLSPLFRSTVGFDYLDKLLDSAFRDAGRFGGYPPLDIARIGQDEYRVSMAVAGFAEGDIEIEVRDGILTVKGRIREPEQGVEHLHRGVARRPFEHRLQMADHVKVTGATLRDGMLDISLEREVPEAMKPRKIEIGAAGPAPRSVDAAA